MKKTEYTTFNAVDAARHRAAIRQAHLKQLLPKFLKCDEAGRRKFSQIINREDLREVHEMAERIENKQSEEQRND